MTAVYRYHCEPATPDDVAALCRFLHLAADYRRELAQIENRARTLLRCRPDDALRAHVYDQQGIAVRSARERAVAQGLHWGTYQNAEEAHSDSCRSTKVYDDIRMFVPRDVGTVAVHLQPARTLAAAEGWISVGSDLVRRGSEIDRSGRVRPSRHRLVRLRIGVVGDGPGKGPLWVGMLVRMHREIPKDGVVSWARVQRRKVGSMYRWELHVTVANAAGAPAQAPRAVLADRSDDPSVRANAHSVGVDIGWRHFDGRVRIASWWGTDGRSGDVTISDYILAGDDKADSLRAIRDRHKNTMRDRIRMWVAELADRSCWVVEATASIHSWLKTWRFVRLARQWRDQRIARDDQIYEEIAAWMKQDRHLWNWEAAARERRKRQVDEVVRLLAVNLARDYARIGIEKPFVAKILKRAERCDACRDLPKRCDSCADSERMRHVAASRVPHAAPARTRQEILTFAAKYGAVAIEIDPAYTTMDCATCGWRRDDVADWTPREIACSACGVIEDQDRTAAMNLARRASATVLDEHGKPLDPSDSRTSTRKLGSRRTRKVIKVDRSQPIT